MVTSPVVAVGLHIVVWLVYPGTGLSKKGPKKTTTGSKTAQNTAAKYDKLGGKNAFFSHRLMLLGLFI